MDGEETTAAVTLDGGNVSSIRFPDGYGPVDELRFDRTARPAKIDIPDTYIEGRDADVAVLSATVGLNALLMAEALGRNTAVILSASSNTYSYSPEEIAEALETSLEEMTGCDGAECGYDQATNLFSITATVNGIVYTCSVGLRVDETGRMDVARPRCSAAR
jgi:hypothetical protein